MTEDYAARLKEFKTLQRNHLVCFDDLLMDMKQHHPSYVEEALAPLRAIIRELCQLLERDDIESVTEFSKKFPLLPLAMDAVVKRLAATPGGKKRGTAISREAAVLRDKVMKTRKIVLDVNPALAKSTRSLAAVIARNLEKPTETVLSILKRNKQT